MARSLTGIVSSYLYKQRIRQDSLAVEKLAATAAPLFEYARSAELDELLTASGAEMGGRLLALDPDGKVQADSFGLLLGTRPAVPEAVGVLALGEQTAYAIHREEGEEAGTACCASAMVGASGRVGALVFISSVGEMMESLARVEREWGGLFIGVALAAMAVALVFSGLLTRPITALTRTIRRMGQGDLSARVTVRASGELRTLAESYNAMAEQIESLDRSRNQFVSNASHELKTPLATMKIMLETMLYQPDMPEELRAEFMADMDHEIDRLTGIVTDLLTLTRLDNHQMELKPERFDLSEAAEEVLRLLAPAAEKRGQSLRGEIGPDIEITGDRGKIVQILHNLTENAMKYTPDGGEITVGLRSAGREAVLTVRDNGVGIRAEDQAHIFDRFYRVDKARSRETGGTGLGLSIVKQLVQLHGGRITVSSEPGKGSVFTVTLPQEGRA